MVYFNWKMWHIRVGSKEGERYLKGEPVPHRVSISSMMIHTWREALKKIFEFRLKGKIREEKERRCEKQSRRFALFVPWKKGSAFSLLIGGWIKIPLIVLKNEDWDVMDAADGVSTREETLRAGPHPELSHDNSFLSQSQIQVVKLLLYSISSSWVPSEKLEMRKTINKYLFWSVQRLKAHSCVLVPRNLTKKNAYFHGVFEWQINPSWEASDTTVGPGWLAAALGFATLSILSRKG